MQAEITTPNIEKVLASARWAPSGDNTQCWRFEIVDESNFVIHGSDTRDWCVYDLDGRASQIAIGALMENVVIAASDVGLRPEFRRRDDAPETNPTIEVNLVADGSVVREPLVDFVRHRVTQRRPFSTTPLTPVQKKRLENSVGSDYSVTWIEGRGKRWEMARLLFHNARIRLTIPEAFGVHRRIIEWSSQYSEDRIPDQAVGLDPVGLKLMRWAMHSWKRVDFLNRYFAGTWLPRMQLDLMPGFFCGAHFLIFARNSLNGLDDYLEGGRAMQRFWLTATQQGLQFQPEMTPLIFSRYIHHGRRFTETENAMLAAERLAQDLASATGKEQLESAVFMGRVGYGPYPSARSLRLPVVKLLTKKNDRVDATAR